MSKTSRPNFFEFASSETILGAFLWWLLAWADTRHSESEQALHHCARDLVRRLLEVGAVPEPGEYSSVALERQEVGADIVARLDDTAAILIAGAFDLAHRSKRFAEYRLELGRKYGLDRLACVHVTTGDRSNYEKVRAARFGVFRSRDLLDVLRRHSDATAHAIFEDCLDRLERTELELHSCLTQPASEWRARSRPWAGFVQAVRDRLGNGEWGYVPAPAGGFWGLWWSHASIGPEGAEVYLQLENDRLCYKVAFPESSDGESRRGIGAAWQTTVMQAAENLELPVTPAPRLRPGRYATVASLSDCMVLRENGIVDLDATVASIRKAEKVHAAAIARMC